MIDLLFVYGTLRQGNTNAMAAYLAKQSEYLAAGWFQGCLYAISDYPGAIASSDPEHRVYGEIVRLNNAETVLSVLDDYEECGPQHRQPTAYQRVHATVHSLEGVVFNPVWIYLYQWPIVDKPFIAHGDFMRVK